MSVTTASCLAECTFNAASTWATSALDTFWCTSVENDLKQQLIFFFSGYHCTSSPTEQVTMLKQTVHPSVLWRLEMSSKTSVWLRSYVGRLRCSLPPWSPRGEGSTLPRIKATSQPKTHTDQRLVVGHTQTEARKALKDSKQFSKTEIFKAQSRQYTIRDVFWKTLFRDL